MTVPPDQSRHQICRSHLSRPCYPHFGCWRGIRRRDYLAHKRGNIADTNTHNQQPSSRSRRGLCIAWLAVERALFHDLGRLLGCELFIVSRFMHSSGVRLCSQCSSDNTGATSARRAWWDLPLNRTIAMLVRMSPRRLHLDEKSFLTRIYEFIAANSTPLPF